MTIENLEYDALLEKFKKILRENGLKYTQQREVLLKTLYNNDEAKNEFKKIPLNSQLQSIVKNLEHYQGNAK